MRIRLIPWFLAALLVPLAAGAADVAPTRVALANGCYRYTMCAAETDTGACKNAGGTSVIAQPLQGQYTTTFYATQSVGAISCDVYSNDLGAYDATYKQKLNSTAMSTSAYVLSLEGLFDYVWVECTSVGTQATVTMLTCPLSR